MGRPRRWLRQIRDLADRRSALAVNTVWALIAEATQVVLSGALFVVLVLVLEPEEYGLLGAALAVAAAAGGLAFVGSQQLLVRSLAVDSIFSEEWNRSFTTLMAGSTVVCASLFALQDLVLPQLRPTTFAFILISQIFFFGLTELAIYAAQGHRRLLVAAQVRVASGAVRLGVLGLFLIFGSRSLNGWAPWLLAGNALAAAVALLLAWRAFGHFPRLTRIGPGRIRAGFPYMLSQSSNSLLDSADRPMLVGYGFESEAGVYFAGYRIAALAGSPIRAIAGASDADFFAAGAKSARSAYLLAISTTKRAAGVGVVIAVVLFVGAGIVEFIAGDEYAETTDVIRLLSLLPLVRSLQVFAANALTAIGRHSMRIGMLLLALLSNLLLNIALIPRYDWRGALGATFLAELLFAAGLWIGLQRFSRKPREKVGL